MSNISDILSATSHRPFEIPEGQWKYYQEWNDVLFLHWKVPYDVVRKCVPEKLVIDTFEGDCYVSLVPFTMQRIRPRFLPALSFISDFHEINVRTYIKNEEKEGVYFINIEAEKHIAAFVARTFSGLPYGKSLIKRNHRTYRSTNSIKSFQLDIEFDIKQAIEHKSAFEKWVTERYCLYLDNKEHLYRYDVHHREWGLKNIKLTKLELDYKINGLQLGEHMPDAVQYSDGVEVIAWKKVKI
ncbi:MAG: DUF2071 domain-containing protein [Sphingobacteriales bacterium]|nr:MAG: DUF2071 domain-containing protein [Sphingobacteriales bacterium]